VLPTQALERAVADHRAGNLDDAERGYLAVLESQPSNGDALHLLGAIAFARGELERARDLIRAGVAAAPNNAPARLNLARVYEALGALDEAIDAYERFNGAVPSDPPALVSLGNCYHKQGRLTEAVGAFERAVAADPVLGIARINLANVLLQTRRYDEALGACRAALALEDAAPARLVLAQALTALGRLEEAGVELERARVLDPESADVLTNLGVHWYVLGDAERAASYSQRAIERDPARVRAHFNLAISHLLAGRFPEGWAEFEWRARDVARRADFGYSNVPRWDGMRFDGKRLLVSKEQGLGDMIFVARYLPAVAALGGETIFEVPHEAYRLMQRLPGITAYDSARGPVDTTGIELQCPAFSLPGVFGTVESTIPNTVPYLSTDDALTARWRERLQLRRDVRNVGIVWAGYPDHRLDRFRSCTLADLAPLGGVEGIRWISVQKGARASDGAPSGFAIERLDTQIADLDDTASILRLLDLVITVDTSVAHLAGALGVPVWTLLGLGTDWRWMLGRTDSPWYPTMRLFRQRVPGDWRSLAIDVAGELRAL
jgi:tetratricopeptide (TPR) repeat protein